MAETGVPGPADHDEVVRPDAEMTGGHKLLRAQPAGVVETHAVDQSRRFAAIGRIRQVRQRHRSRPEILPVQVNFRRRIDPGG